MTSRSYFGNEEFQFNGSGRDLFGSFLLALVLSTPTLGLYWYGLFHSQNATSCRNPLITRV